MFIVYSVRQCRFMEEEEIKNQKPIIRRTTRKRVKLDSYQSRGQIKKSNIHDDDEAFEVGCHQSDSSSGWSSEVIEPAIKSMNFRKKRGTNMKELLKGKNRKDQFWDKYQNYFGGGLDGEDDSDDLEDYEASSSGRDEFDSDFDLTDSYVGKRGRKKGTKMKRRKTTATKPKQSEPEGQPKPKVKRGRKPKAPVASPLQQRSEILLKEGKEQIIESPAHYINEKKVSNTENAEEKRMKQFSIVPETEKTPEKLVLKEESNGKAKNGQKESKIEAEGPMSRDERSEAQKDRREEGQ